MPDAWRAYLEMALGLTEAPRKRAQKVVGDLTSRGGATAAQLQGLVDDLLSAGLANREALTNIVRHEVDRALGVVGLATAEEVDELTTRVRDLERQLRQARAAAAGDGAATEPGGARLEQPAPLPRKVAKKAVAKKAVKATPNAMPAAGTRPPANPARAATADGPAAKANAAADAAAVAAATEAAPARKAAAKKAVAKKAVAKKAVAKKAAPAPAEPAVPAGTAEAPTAPVKAAAAATELPPVQPVDFSEAGVVDRGEAGVTPAADAAATPARKTAARKAPAKKAAPARKTAAKKAAPRNPEA